MSAVDQIDIRDQEDCDGVFTDPAVDQAQPYSTAIDDMLNRTRINGASPATVEALTAVVEKHHDV